MSHSNLQRNSCRPHTILSYKEFTNFEQSVVSQQMQQPDCEWGWFCTAEDENNPNATYPVPIMNYTHKKVSQPIVANKPIHSPYEYVLPIMIEPEKADTEDGKIKDIASKKLFYYLSHCALFSVIILISTYA